MATILPVEQLVVRMRLTSCALTSWVLASGTPASANTLPLLRVRVRSSLMRLPQLS